MTPMRIVDSGLRPARWNVAMTAALLALHREGRIPDTLRFHRYQRSVLIGRHQDYHGAVRGWDRVWHPPEVARRITGGGAIYMCPGILAWDVVVGRGSIGHELAAVAGRICEGVATGLGRLGLPARYRPPNAVEVNGRKVCGSSGSFEGQTLIFQGTVLIDFDFDDMAALLVADGDADGRADLRRCVVSLADLLDRAPDHEEVQDALVFGLSRALVRPLISGTIATEEMDLAARLYEDEIGTDEFVVGEGRLTVVRSASSPNPMRKAGAR